MTKILVIDDEEDILALLSYNLQKEGYETICAESGEEGYQLAKTHKPDLILLDLMLPQMSGTELLTKIRLTRDISHIPVIILSAKGSEDNIVGGLNQGAYDYISKPFSIKVLIAKIKKIRAADSHKEAVNKSGIMVDEDKHMVTIDGQETKLTLSEFRLLSLFITNSGRVYKRNEIIDKIKSSDYIVEERSIDQLIKCLRQKLKNKSSLIETIRGIGYKFSG